MSECCWQGWTLQMHCTVWYSRQIWQILWCNIFHVLLYGNFRKGVYHRIYVIFTKKYNTYLNHGFLYPLLFKNLNYRYVEQYCWDIWFYQECNLLKKFIKQNRFVTKVFKLVNAFDFWFRLKDSLHHQILSIWLRMIELPQQLLLSMSIWLKFLVFALLWVIYVVASQSFLFWSCFPKLFFLICEGQTVHIVFNSHALSLETS